MTTQSIAPTYERPVQLPTLFLLLLSCWGLLNLTQSIFTEIGHDEAYYWMYSRALDWGYFDHPPMIALWIWAGSHFFQGTLGVRFFTVLAQLVTIILIWSLTGIKSPTNKNVITFFILAASIVMFEVYGFIATPDSPLLLFTAVFLTGYHRFLHRQDAMAIFLLATSMALLMYSKYHGLLVILFVLLSNPKILRSPRLWLAIFLSVIAYIPHLLWQLDHDFPSIRYHLYTRSRPVNIKHILNFIPNQLVAFNPFLLALAGYVLYKFRPVDLFERSLYTLSIGFFGFFFASTLRGHVEPHWTIAASIPLVIIIYGKSAEQPSLNKYIFRVIGPSILILIFLRLALIFDILPVHLQFHGQKAWTTILSQKAGDLPVVFRNSYQQPSVYSFYTGKPAIALNNIYYRHTQYDIWPSEETLFGHPALLVTNISDPGAQPLDLPNGKKMYVHEVDHFFSAQKLHIQYELNDETVWHALDTVSLQAQLINPYTYPIDFNFPYFPIACHTMFVKSGNDMTVSPAIIEPPINQLLPGQRIPVNIKFEVPDICTRKYKFALTLKAGLHQEAFSSSVTPVMVLEK